MDRNPVLEFISRRFPDLKESNWLSGNCYFFSVILYDRFQSLEPEIFYDVIHGHFLTMIEGCLYDASGLVYKLSKEEQDRMQSQHVWLPIDLDYDVRIVSWKYFKDYDASQYYRILRDCIE